MRREILAGFIIYCSRDRGSSQMHGNDLRRCALHLSPDNIDPHPPDVRVEDGFARAVVNPVPAVSILPRGVRLGALFEEADWATVGTCLLYTSDAADDLLCVDLGG